MSKYSSSQQDAPVIRAATVDDVAYIHTLLHTNANQGNLLPRPPSEIVRHLRDFFVLDHNGEPVVCGALEVFTEDLGEVRSLVVSEPYMRRGFGKLMVEWIATEARDLGLRRLMALTYVPQFFGKLGFEIVPKESLPEKIWGVCITCYKFHRCDETAMLRRL
ncbi:MAG: N-acetyltransferase [Gammaproteobacteria bacterium]|nr:N-acetyltransferase [Gammaproteobacteria bacterium]